MRALGRRRWMRAALLTLAAATLFGCEQDPGLADRYAAEKLAWEAAKNTHAMRTNPRLATDDMRDRVVGAYSEIVKRFPPPPDPSVLSPAQLDVASLAARSRMRLGEMAVEAGDLAAAVRYFSSVRDSYGFDRVVAVEGAIALAQAHERLGSWDGAVEAYAELTADWPPADSDEDVPDARIMRAPIRVAAGYVTRGDTERARRWFDTARDYYDEWISKWPDSATAEIAMSFKAETYLMEERWTEAVGAYELLDRRYGNDGNRPGIWLTLADTYSSQLDRPEKAREYYLKVVENYPDDIAAATASLALAASEIEESRHEAARARLVDVAQRFADEEAIRATAIQYLAVSYEKQGMWENALSQLNALAREHPTTMYGLAALQHIADHYRETGDEAAEKAALAKAAEHYERVIRDYASTPAELAARGYLIDTRLKQEHWNEAAKALVETAERFPDSESSPDMMLQAVALYRDRLGDSESAARVLRSMMNIYEGRPAATQAERLLEALGD